MHIDGILSAEECLETAALNAPLKRFRPRVAMASYKLGRVPNPVPESSLFGKAGTCSLNLWGLGAGRTQNAAGYPRAMVSANRPGRSATSWVSHSTPPRECLDD